jgi:hypothetical protein
VSSGRQPKNLAVKGRGLCPGGRLARECTVFAPIALKRVHSRSPNQAGDRPHCPEWTIVWSIATKASTRASAGCSHGVGGLLARPGRVASLIASSL